jgi:hypothetical protein
MQNLDSKSKASISSFVKEERRSHLVNGKRVISDSLHNSLGSIFINLSVCISISRHLTGVMYIIDEHSEALVG